MGKRVGVLAAAQGGVASARGDAALQLLREAADDEESVEKLPVTPGRRAALQGAMQAAERVGDADAVKQLRVTLPGD